MTTILLGGLIVAATIILISLLLVFGRREDSGCSMFQKIILAQFRLSRWVYAKGQGWNAFLVLYRMGRAAQKKAYRDAMNTPLPDLMTERESCRTQTPEENQSLAPEAA